MRRMHSAHHAISSHHVIAPPSSLARQYGCKRSSLRLLLLLHGKVAASIKQQHAESTGLKHTNACR